MTDSDIVKALKVCTSAGASCKNCPAYVKVDRSKCKEVFRGTLDLINRQKAEIDCLQKELHKKMYDFETEYDSKIKAEAIKEFAEKILNEIREAIISNDKAIKEREEKHNANRYEDNFCSMCDGKISALGGIRYFINNLLKELVR